MPRPGDVLTFGEGNDEKFEDNEGVKSVLDRGGKWPPGVTPNASNPQGNPALGGGGDANKRDIVNADEL